MKTSKKEKPKKKASSSSSSSSSSESKKKEIKKKPDIKPDIKTKPKPKPKPIGKPISDQKPPQEQKGYTINIHIIKPKIESKNEKGFLKDNSDKEEKKASTDEFILLAEQTIMNDIDILEEKKKNYGKKKIFLIKLDMF